MSDFRQAAIDAILEDLTFDSVKELRAYVSKNKQDDYFYGGILYAINAVQDLSPEQPKSEERTAESAQNVPNDELISKKAAIELVRDVCDAIMSGCESWYDPEIENEVYKDTREVDAILKCKKEVRIALRNMQSAQPTLYGYDIKHLMLIAEVLRKENLPPERVTEALMDIGRIVSIVSDEFEESLREAMKQCKI